MFERKIVLREVLEHGSQSQIHQNQGPHSEGKCLHRPHHTVKKAFGPMLENLIKD